MGDRGEPENDTKKYKIVQTIFLPNRKDILRGLHFSIWVSPLNHRIQKMLE